MKNTIHCPKCGTEIDVNHVLHSQIQDKMQSKFQLQLNQLNSDFEAKQKELQIVQEKINEDRAHINDVVQKSLSERLTLEKVNLEKKIRKTIEDEKSEQISEYQRQLDEKLAEVKGLNKLKADFERLSREKDELRSQIEAEAEVKVSQLIAEEKQKLRAEKDSKAQLKLLERELVIQQLKDQLQIAQQKAEQGSMQIQGEVQEIAMEDFLNETFPYDVVEEVKKGARGADCMQIVYNNATEPVGSIYYESKRTKDFQPSWLEKFKKDMRLRKASFGVLVTEVYPKGMERMGLVNGIWVCSFEEFKGLAFVLREAVLMLHDASLSQENKGTKMEMLYAYLTSNEFKQHVEGIVEGFATLQNDLSREKRSMESIWKQREKHIQSVLLNTTHMYSSIRGIAGNAIASIKMLELPE